MKKGYKMSDEHKLKLSLSKLGEKNPRFGKPGTQLGLKRSRYTKNKISLSKKGKNNGISGEKHPMYGKVYTKEEKLRISLKLRGPLCYNWQGGITELNLSIRNSSLYKQWRNDIFVRDHYTCVICKKVGGKLNVDHINSFSQILRSERVTSVQESEKCCELWDIKNGRTLCIQCHRKTDNYGGRIKKTVGMGIINQLVTLIQ